MTTEYPRLSPEVLETDDLARYQSIRSAPVTILQIGEGNFLRGFVDWMVHECRKQGLYDGSIVVTQPRPTGANKLKELEQQGGLYTLVVRGLDNGQRVERREVISVFSKTLDPYQQWSEFLACAENPDLQVIVSNTTEAGLVYQRIELDETEPPVSFPAKLTLFLYRRYVNFDGLADKGLILLPCELVDGNGDRLLEYVIRHSEDWGLPTPFIAWIRNHNRFLNSLVDRIVSGFPEAETDTLRREIGYDDTLLSVAEPYHLWAIEGDETFERLLPFRRAGLNVHWVTNLAPYQIRKVRILNGSHTLMAPMGLLRGLTHVGEVVHDDALARHIQQAITNEILPTLPLDVDELRAYADTVWERFANPFLKHRLVDISMNSISKFRVRLLPTVIERYNQTHQLPARIIQSFAELIRLYNVRKSGAGYVGRAWTGSEVVIRDDAKALETFRQLWTAHDTGELSLMELVQQVLSNPEMWGEDLGHIDQLGVEIFGHLQRMEL